MFAIVVVLATISKSEAISVGKTKDFQVPSWKDLSESLPPISPPLSLDYALSRQDSLHDTLSSEVVTLYRERNGWCIYSARLWLALEMKGIEFQTVLLDLKYDTYDGSASDFNGDWPIDLEGMSLPLLQLPNSEEIHSGATEESSLHLLEYLDGVS